jgi:hypothetical protein
VKIERRRKWSGLILKHRKRKIGTLRIIRRIFVRLANYYSPYNLILIKYITLLIIMINGRKKRKLRGF